MMCCTSQTGPCWRLSSARRSIFPASKFCVWPLIAPFPPVHPSMLGKWIKFKFRIENTGKAHQKITQTNNRHHRTRGVFGSHESQQILWYSLCASYSTHSTEKHWECWCVPRGDDMTGAQAQRHHLNNFYTNTTSQTSAETPSVDWSKE